MALKIAVCDDVASDRQLITSLIKKEDLFYECSSYESGEKLLWDLDSGKNFDIIFLDIFMNGISGIETAKCIRSTDDEVIIIFISSSDDFYRESYDLYAFNYLIKPLVKDKLSEVLSRAVNKLNKDELQTIRFSFNNTFYTLQCSQLMYLSSEKHIVCFYLKGGDILKSYGRLDDFIPQLPEEIFIRCHQSYIINLKFVTNMTSSDFTLGNVKVPISRKYLKHAREKYCTDMFADF